MDSRCIVFLPKHKCYFFVLGFVVSCQSEYGSFNWQVLPGSDENAMYAVEIVALCADNNLLSVAAGKNAAKSSIWSHQTVDTRDKVGKGEGVVMSGLVAS